MLSQTVSWSLNFTNFTFMGRTRCAWGAVY
jgi:hypothetical protein